MKKNSLMIGLFAILLSFVFGGQSGLLALGVPSAFAEAADPVCDCTVSIENVDDDRDASDNADNTSNTASSNTAFSNTYSNQSSDDNILNDSTANVADDDNSDANDAQDNIANVAAGPVCICPDGSPGILVDPLNPSAPTNMRGVSGK